MIKQVLDLQTEGYPITNRFQGGLYGYFKNESSFNKNILYTIVIVDEVRKPGDWKYLYKVIPLFQTRNACIMLQNQWTKKELLEKMIIFTTTTNDDVKTLITKGLEEFDK